MNEYSDLNRVILSQFNNKEKLDFISSLYDDPSEVNKLLDVNKTEIEKHIGLDNFLISEYKAHKKSVINNLGLGNYHVLESTLAPEPGNVVIRSGITPRHKSLESLEGDPSVFGESYSYY